MPRPTDQQIAYMALCVITELDAAARRAAAPARQAVAARDRLGELVRSGGQIAPDLLEPFIARAERVGAEVEEAEGNVRNLRHSEYALHLARNSLS